MSRHPRIPVAEIRDIAFLKHAEAPLFQQLYQALGERILDGRIRPETYLPSSRALAEQLKVSRNTVIAAYDQLIAEGYLQSKPGAGTFVAKDLPESWFHTKTNRQSKTPNRRTVTLSRYAEAINSQSALMKVISASVSACLT